jgi:predicted RNase H-like HicB family nuclease
MRGRPDHDRVGSAASPGCTIEATEDPSFFGFYSTELEGFTGVGNSVEDCLYKAKWGMIEYVGLLEEMGLPVPRPNPNPCVIIENTSPVSTV